MPNQVEEFNAYRAKMNDKILADNNKVIKRIFNQCFLRRRFRCKNQRVTGFSSFYSITL